MTRPARQGRPVQRAVAVRRSAVAQLAGGLGTGALAGLLSVWVVLVALLCVVGIGLLLAPAALAAVRSLADRERGRLVRWGSGSPPGGPPPASLRPALADRAVRRDLVWLPVHATGGLLLGLVGVLLPVYAVRDLTFPLWWPLVPATVDASPWWWPVRTWADTWPVALLGLAWALLTVGAAPRLARLQGSLAQRLLAPPPGTDLTLRVAQLSATRAAALDGHATELRRIERSLHDGAQNRLVGVTVLLGAARRSLARPGVDRGSVDELLERAQGAAEQALGELRAVVRSILPPVLVDRGLTEAVTGLAAACPVTCHLEVDAGSSAPGALPASVEATAYFVVAEALTNVARHSDATRVVVTVRYRGDELLVTVTDDGRGGATVGAGTGLSGMLDRVQAHDGDLRVTSPSGGPTTVEVRLPCAS
ncbi:sensor histidine kinase [Modestobacter sp. I12A-02628]|uniref:histidine kinase n=1 Tax=Goekera deserti TaxID=2497753 RepID=A0A7K3WH28_9ACTN|nr:sensor histidine kinase [Goekera deserti]MPQ99367.1 sensor histidine kinase [Goekera deserti]NDI50366.1 sensor histidine kinase [Goekera deserti]NEL55676.1 sensor histidine kinase [Goekera deserti]